MGYLRTGDLIMQQKPQTIKIEFICKKCELTCKLILNVNKEMEDKQPTTELRKVCLFFSSRDNYAMFEMVN